MISFVFPSTFTELKLNILLIKCMFFFKTETVIFAVTGIIYYDISVDPLNNIRVLSDHAHLCFFNVKG